MIGQAAAAGARMREVLKIIAESPTALGGAARGTSSGMSASLIGVWAEDTAPNSVAKHNLGENHDGSKNEHKV